MARFCSRVHRKQRQGEGQLSSPPPSAPLVLLLLSRTLSLDQKKKTHNVFDSEQSFGKLGKQVSLGGRIGDEKEVERRESL